MNTNVRNYLAITGGYWAFTLTDGAIRMLVVLYFHQLGYSPFEVAILFLFYEFFGIVTSLVGGWLAARLGLNVTMHFGMALQVLALMMLTVPEPWLSIAYVMFAQALSGIAKDLNKMSAKAGVKTLVTKGGNAKLFKWVGILTGSKNALKGVGFFLGGGLLEWFGFRQALIILASGLFVVMVLTIWFLPRDLGKSKEKHKFTQVFSKNAAINWLSAARFFLFGARDVWFVVALPVFLSEVLGWNYTQIGGFLALWVIGYGIVQASAPKLLRIRNNAPSSRSAQISAAILLLVPASISFALTQGVNPELVIVIGLLIFGAVFAINSALHSYLILAYAEDDKVALNVGFYYMANAGGRLTGTILSGWGYQQYGLEGCLMFSAGSIAIAFLLSLGLPRETHFYSKK
jgi:predicted MFS family arabinose efflux permease